MFTSLSNAQLCEGRYQNDIFSETTKSTVKFGRSQNSAGQYQDLYMDIYEGKGDTARLRPVVIFCFGGAFISGTRESSSLVFMAQELAKKGYVSACIDYRLASSAAFLIQEENMIKTVFRTIHDGKAAVRFFRKDAQTSKVHKIDQDQIFMGGTSAGGILSVNLAYLNDSNKLSAEWQKWISEIGGMEGNSGNSGYCSYVNGVFSFAGGIADTSFIDPNDPPLYATHSLLDGTVRFGKGRPLGGLAAIDLYGSGPLIGNLKSKGIYTQFDSFGGLAHPPHSNPLRLTPTKDHLTEFLYDILDCNPANKKKTNQRICSSNSLKVRHTRSLIDVDLEVYPNPTNGTFQVKGKRVLKKINILDGTGRVVYEGRTNSKNIKLNLEHLSKGIYSLIAQYSDDKRATLKVIIK